MKYRGHESFYIRKNWLSKGILAIKNECTIFNKEKYFAMDELGVGKNMVQSIKYWLKACCITEDKRENKKNFIQLTPFGKIIEENDVYIQETGTQWLIQYQLAKNKNDATSWYFFFNEFNFQEFTKEDFIVSLQSFDRMQDDKGKKDTSISSFESDFECLIGTYTSRYRNQTKKIDPEENMECPLAELGLIELFNPTKKNYRKVIPPKQNIPSLIVLSVLIASSNNKKEISLSDIQNKPCNVGRIFNLDTITLMDILTDLENKDYIHIIRTAGLDVVQLKTDMNFEDCIKKYYEGLNK